MRAYACYAGILRTNIHGGEGLQSGHAFSFSSTLTQCIQHYSSTRSLGTYVNLSSPDSKAELTISIGSQLTLMMYDAAASIE